MDEHFYMSPDWFLTQANRYDTYDRTSAKVFAGEYAAQDGSAPALDRGGYGNTLYSAVAEAAFLTGVERNADVVEMASYAPLFAKIDQHQWTPNMIWFDNFDVSYTPNYYVQQMFSCNYGDETLNIREDDSTVAEDSGEECGSVALASWNTQVEYDNLKVKDKNGEIIFEDDFDDGKIDESKWVIQSGQWKEEDGVLRQTGGETPALIYLNQDVLPEGFSGGSVAVEATKTGGAEGFLVGYDFRDTENYYWYNVGYLNNTADKVERSVNNVRQAFLTTAGNLYKNTETGTTYSIEINYDSDSAEIYKDNVLPMTYGTHYIYSCATRDSATGDIYLKLVNSEGKDKKVHIDVENMDGNFRSAVKTEVASYDKNIQNSIRQPENIRPKTSVITDMTELESYTIPAYSVTVLQLSRKESEAEPPEEEDNLQLYYKFDSKAGAEVKDYSGNGYNGTMQVLGGGETEDPAWTEEGFAFSGNNYIKLTGADLVSEDITVVFRVKRTEKPDAPYSFFWGKNQSDYAGNGIWINSANDNAVFVSTNGFDHNFYTTGISREEFYPKDEWVEVAVTVDSQTGRYAVYRNGEKMKTEGASAAVVTKPSDAYNTIGMAGYDNELIKGMEISRFMIFDKALSQDEVKDLYGGTEEDDKVCVVNFDGNGQELFIEPQKITEGSRAEEPRTPSADGWKFEGWYQEKECINEWNFAEDAVKEDMTLYAKWSHVHKMEYYAENAATCCEEGVMEHWHCTVCGRNFADENGRREMDSIKSPVDPDNHTGGSAGWEFDENYHWKVCACGKKTEKEEHTYEDGKCAVCGYVIDSGTDEPEEYEDGDAKTPENRKNRDDQVNAVKTGDGTDAAFAGICFAFAGIALAGVCTVRKKVK